MPALLAVLAAFMAGLALGAWAISKIIIRSCGRSYAWLELGIGVWAVCTAALLPAANRFALTWTGIDPSPVRHWFIAFLIPLVVLLPATACMGATLPVIERLLTPFTTHQRSVGGLYAANTLGAVVGVLASAFLILPTFGLRTALFAFAALNICCALIAFALAGKTVNAPVVESSPPPRRIWATLFLTGLLGIGYEVVGARLLAQILEGTVYTCAAVLSVFLLGTAFGAAIYQRIGQRGQLAGLLSLTTVACVAGILAATQADGLYRFLRELLSDSVAGVLMAEVLVAVTVFFLPTALMGATFSHLAHAARRSLGKAVAINTLGAAMAPVLFSIVLLPWLGSKWTLLIIACSYAVIAGMLRPGRWIAAASVATILALLPADQLRFLAIPTGGRVLEFQEGVMASVAVVEDALAHKSLRVDNRFQMGGTGVAEAEYRHAHIPLLLHPKPKRALFLGLGTGITFDAAALHADLVADGVELLREVVDVMPQFSPYNDSVRTNTRLAVFVADARRFVRGTTNVYDVIVGDLFHPARDGAGSLYTLEHFRGIRERLAGGGLFCQWLPLHQLDADTLRVIIRTFLEVFPNAQAWLLRFNVETPVIGLIGRTDTITYTPNWIEKRDESPSLAERLQKLALADSLRLFGNILCGPGELSALASTACINTDDNSAVLFGAPAFSYRDNARLHNPLTVFLELQLTNTATLLGFRSADLERFVSARNIFLRGLIDEAHGRIAEACERYIESARVSDNFTAGYARVVTIAAAEARSQPEKSRKLLEQLIEAQPARPVAKQLLQRLFSKPEP